MKRRIIRDHDDDIAERDLLQRIGTTTTDEFEDRHEGRDHFGARVGIEDQATQAHIAARPGEQPFEDTRGHLTDADTGDEVEDTRRNRLAGKATMDRAEKIERASRG